MNSLIEEIKLESVNDAVREEYGEPDRPMPNDQVQEIDGKFVEWEVYKMKNIKNQQRNMKSHVLKER